MHNKLLHINSYLFLFFILIFAIALTKNKYLIKNYQRKIILRSLEKKECPKVGLYIAYFGQSNTINRIPSKTSFEIPDNLFQYNWKSGECFSYKEPLIGVAGMGGNSFTYAAINIANNFNEDVVIIPFGEANSSILDWSYGYLSYKIDLVVKRLSIDKINPDFFIFHQGESDLRAKNLDPVDLLKTKPFEKTFNYKTSFGLNYRNYSSALGNIIDNLLKIYPSSYFGISLVSRCNSNSWVPVSQAQKDLAKSKQRTFIAANSDEIYGREMRYDNCHFNENGAKEIGFQYYQSIKKILKNKYQINN